MRFHSPAFRRREGIALALATLLVPAASARAVDLTVDTVAPERPVSVSLALDASGTPHIGYTLGSPSNALKYAEKSGGTWTVETVNPSGTFGNFAALALDPAGKPHLAYAPDGAWYAEKTTGTWHAELIDAGAASSQVAIAVDSSGAPHVVYPAGGGLTYAVRADTGWVKEPIGPGWGPSLVLDEAGDPHVGYALPTGPLKYAERKNNTWSFTTVDSVATSGGSGYFDPPSLELDSAGEPHLSYMANDPDYNLKYAARAAGIWTTAVVDSAGLLGWYNSLALDTGDRPHITYTGPNDELMYARFDGATWNLETLDPTSSVGDFNSLQLTPAGPHIAYRDYPGNRLAYAYPTPPTGAAVASEPARGPVLDAPRPNPQVGPGETVFRFTLPSAQTARLMVHDVRGRAVATWEAALYPAGPQTVTWDPGTLPSGVYWVRLVTDSGFVARARWVRLL